MAQTIAELEQEAAKIAEENEKLRKEFQKATATESSPCREAEAEADLRFFREFVAAKVQGNGLKQREMTCQMFEELQRLRRQVSGAEHRLVAVREEAEKINNCSLKLARRCPEGEDQ